MAKKRKRAVKGQARSARTPELVTWALQGIQQAIAETRARLAELEAQARKLRGTVRGAAAELFAGDEADAAPTARKATRARKKRTLSAEARRRIAEAQKRRWAKVKKEKSSSPS